MAIVFVTHILTTTPSSTKQILQREGQQRLSRPLSHGQDSVFEDGELGVSGACIFNGWKCNDREASKHGFWPVGAEGPAIPESRTDWEEDHLGVGGWVCKIVTKYLIFWNISQYFINLHHPQTKNILLTEWQLILSKYSKYFINCCEWRQSSSLKIFY